MGPLCALLSHSFSPCPCVAMQRSATHTPQSFDEEETSELHNYTTPLNGAKRTETDSNHVHVLRPRQALIVNGQAKLKPSKLLIFIQPSEASRSNFEHGPRYPTFSFISTFSHASLASTALGFFGGRNRVHGFDLATTVDSTTSETTTGAAFGAFGIRGQTGLQRHTS